MLSINSKSITCITGAPSAPYSHEKEAMNVHGLLSFLLVNAFIFAGFGYYFYFYSYFS